MRFISVYLLASLRSSGVTCTESYTDEFLLWRL